MAAHGTDTIRGRARRALLIGIALAACAAGVRAQEVPGYPPSVFAYDPREVALLPKYCLYTQGFRLSHVPGSEDQAITDRWYAYLGPTFHALHHYCWGLMKTNRAVLLARSPDVRLFYLRDSISEFDFVIERAPDTFPLLPEILTKRAENLVRLGRGPVAVENLERAIALKDDYWPAYAELSDYYKSAGDVSKAREMLETGLSRAPGAKALERRMSDLGPERGRKAASKR